MPLRNQVALVTGASRGIGRATAIALAQAGADVAINYYSSDDAAREVADRVEELGRRALLVKADVADQSAVEEVVSKTVAEFGRLDVAVSNAVYSDRKLFYELSMEGFNRTIDVTMWGAFYLLRAAALQMLEQEPGESGQRGAIVIVSSPHGYNAIPMSMPYNMAKGAIDQMARTAAIELAEKRIRVNTLVPGWIDTPGERKFADDETIEKAGTKLPWGRLGRPEEIARGIVFLCDPASDYMTGSRLLIDGGITLPWWAARGSGVPE